MTAKEIIKELEKVDPNTPVLFFDGEYGPQHIEELKSEEISDGPNKGFKYVILKQ